MEFKEPGPAENRSQGNVTMKEWSQKCNLAGFERNKEPGVKECQRPPEVGQGKERDFLLETPKENQPCQPTYVELQTYGAVR